MTEAQEGTEKRGNYLKNIVTAGALGLAAIRGDDALTPPDALASIQGGFAPRPVAFAAIADSKLHSRHLAESLELAHDKLRDVQDVLKQADMFEPVAEKLVVAHDMLCTDSYAFKIIHYSEDPASNTHRLFRDNQEALDQQILLGKASPVELHDWQGFPHAKERIVEVRDSIASIEPDAKWPDRAKRDFSEALSVLNRAVEKFDVVASNALNEKRGISVAKVNSR